MRRILATVASIAALVTLTSCGSGGTGPAAVAPQATVRLGFVADASQTTALVGLRLGIFGKNLRPYFVLRAIPYRTDSAEAAALAAGKIDAAYASTGTILSVISARGAAFLRIISGAATGGTELVVKPGIGSASALKGRTVAVPTGNGPQAIAARYWLAQQHLGGPGQVSVISSGSAAAAAADFSAGRVDGAWVPAPYDTQMLSAGGRVLVNEASLWPGGQYGATNLVVTTTFLTAHSSAVMSLLKGQVQANALLRGNPLQVITAAMEEVKAVTGTDVSSSSFASAFSILIFTNDPVSDTLPTLAKRAAAAGLPAVTGNLATLYDLTPLNLALHLTGEKPVS